MNDGMRKCSKCGIEKPRDQFHKGSGRADGTSSWCKKCKHLADKEYRNRPDVKKRLSAHYREWANENKERRREIARNWARKNKDVRKRYLESERGRLAQRAAAIRRRAGESSGNDLTRDDILDVMSKGVCEICGSRDDLEFDHIIPISRGGRNTKSNGMCLCKTCNRRKHARVVFDGGQARLDPLFVVQQ